MEEQTLTERHELDAADSERPIAGSAPSPSNPVAADDTWFELGFPALRYQCFRYFLIGQFVSVIGSWMQTAALGWYVQTQTRDIGSEYWLGLTGAVSSLPIAILSPLGGVAADRWPKRPVIIATQVAAMIAAFVFGIIVWCNVASMGAVLVFAAIGGAVLAYDVPARQAFAVEMVGRDALLSGIALNSAVFNVGRLLGPMLAGLAIAGLGIASCFVLNALSFIPVIVALAVMKVPHAMPRKPPGAHESIFTGASTVLRTRRLRGLVFLLAFILITGGAYLTILPALAENALGLDSFGYSVLMSANGLGSLVGAVIVACLSGLSARRPAIVGGVVFMGLGLVGLTFAQSLIVASVLLFLVGGGFVVFLASTNSTVQLSVDDSVRGRVMGIWVLTFGAAQPLGSYFAGWLAHEIGTPKTLGIEGLACLAAAAASIVYLWRLRQVHRAAAIVPPLLEH